MPETVVLQPTQISIRHIKLGASTDSGARQVLNQWLVPMDRLGVNGRRGWISGEYERRLNEEGTFSLRFPNAAGEDGMLHRERFEIVTKGRRQWSAGQTIMTVGGGTYRPGDEWFEIYRTSQGMDGELLFVGTPDRAQLSLSTIEVSGYDGMWLLKKQRDTAASWWRNAPRDVIHHYTQVWEYLDADSFGIDNAAETRFTWSTGASNTADGHYSYERAENGSASGAGFQSSVRLRPNAIGPTAYVRGRNSLPFGADNSPEIHWRVEATILAPFLRNTDREIAELSLQTGTNFYMCQLMVGRKTQNLIDSGLKAFFQVYDPSDGSFRMFDWDREANAKLPPPPGPYDLAIEGRGRWLWFYANGEVVGVVSMPADAFTVFPHIMYLTNDVANYCHVDSFRVKRTRQFLQPAGQANWGSYLVPGLLPTGGLIGEYYTTHEFTTEKDRFFSRSQQALTPVREPYARRRDSVVDVSEAAAQYSPGNVPSGTQLNTAGTKAQYFAVRWTGAVYLDLAASEYWLRLQRGSVKEVKWWVGRTVGDTDRLTGNANLTMRTRFGNISGWYPIVIEGQVDVETPWAFKLEWSTNGSTFTTVPSSGLSPIGTFNHQARFDSHYDGLIGAARDYALQFTVEPRQLESGQFPGLLVPRPRVGRDTEKVITSEEGTGISQEITTDEVADILIADAQGLADPTGASQITAEAVDYGEIRGSVQNVPVLGGHLLTAQEYDSVADVASREQLRIRLDSLLALRGSAFEQVSATPAGKRELLDSFPLSGALSEFAWQPGDGVRLQLPEILVDDRSPRQILGVKWQILPDGIPRPAVSFRQRPRNLADALRRLRRETMNQIRNWQTQFVGVTGSPGGNGSGNPDLYTRALLPVNVTDVVRAEFVIHYKSDLTVWDIEINDVKRLSISRTGRYDVTPWVDRVGNEPKMYARAVAGATGTGNLSYTLELVVKI